MRIFHAVRHSDDLVEVSGATNGIYAVGLWVKCKARKETLCAITRNRITPGCLVYRPEPAQGHRGKQILASALDRILRNQGSQAMEETE